MFSEMPPILSTLSDQTKIGILGGGTSGEGAAQLLNKRGVLPLLFDSQPEKSKPELFLSRLSDTAPLPPLDLLVKSPGIPPEHPLLTEAVKQGVPILSEIGLGRFFYSGPVLGITGTDGKSTTTSLAYHLLRDDFSKSQVGGNLGLAFSSFATEAWDMVVLELSSYQLEDSPPLHLTHSAITNLAPDHLERHKTMGRYALAKWKIVDLENANHKCVTSKATLAQIPLARFPESKILLYGEDADCSYRFDFARKKVRTPKFEYTTSQFPLPGKHNLQNLTVAIALAELIEVDPKMIQSRIETFVGLPHRFSKVLVPNPDKRYSHLSFINDSKATNLHSMLSGISGFDAKDKIILILGGRPKGESLEPFFSRWKELNNCFVYIIGEAREVWEKDFSSHVSKEKQNYFSLEHSRVSEVLDVIRQKEGQGQKADTIVIFSPACASFDQYKNFVQRGEDFEKQVIAIFGS